MKLFHSTQWTSSRVNHINFVMYVSSTRYSSHVYHISFIVPYELDIHKGYPYQIWYVASTRCYIIKLNFPFELYSLVKPKIENDELRRI